MTLAASPLPTVFCAIDTTDPDRARALAQICASGGAGIKLGLEFFCAHGVRGVEAVVRGLDAPLFLDLKFHDIPNTVAGALRAVAGLAPAFVNVHAAGGREMMRAGLDALQDGAAKAGVSPARLLAVTVLTSLDAAALAETGQGGSPAEQVLRLARLTHDSGLAGVVCSSHEISVLRDALGPDFVLMVPGIRPVQDAAQAGSGAGARDDQKRVMSPQDAVRLGATHLVIGRPITGAADPAQALSDILTSLF